MFLGLHSFLFPTKMKAATANMALVYARNALTQQAEPTAKRGFYSYLFYGIDLNDHFFMLLCLAILSNI
jgi:hypothetical protein